MIQHYTAPLAVYRVLNQLSPIIDWFLQTAVRTRCSSMQFIVAEWNKPSIDFYKRRGASDLSLEEGWRLFKIDKQNLLKITNEEWTHCRKSFNDWPSGAGVHRRGQISNKTRYFESFRVWCYTQNLSFLPIIRLPPLYVIVFLWRV